MINNLLNKCCYDCDCPDINIETSDYENMMGDVEFKNQTITCNHAPICYRVRQEEEKPKDVKFTIDDCSGCTVGDRAKLMNKFQWRDVVGSEKEINNYEIVLAIHDKGYPPHIVRKKVGGKFGWDWVSDTNCGSFKYWKPIYDESVPCCGLSEDEWNEVMNGK